MQAREVTGVRWTCFSTGSFRLKEETKDEMMSKRADLNGHINAYKATRY